MVDKWLRKFKVLCRVSDACKRAPRAVSHRLHESFKAFLGVSKRSPSVFGCFRVSKGLREIQRRFIVLFDDYLSQVYGIHKRGSLRFQGVSSRFREV